MYSNKNIDYIVDTSEIKKDSCGRCQWLKSIGSNIYITYNNNSSYKKQKSIEKNIRIYTFNYI